MSLVAMVIDCAYYV